MPPSYYLTVLRKRWAGILLSVLLFVLIAAALTLAATPRYTAETRMFFSVRGSETVSELNQGSTYTERQMTSYAELVTSPLVLEPVVDELSLDTTAPALAGQLEASLPPGTVMLDIQATDEDPALAADIANAVAEELGDVVTDLTSHEADDAQLVSASVVSPAREPGTPSEPDPTTNLALGLLLGLGVGIGLALVSELSDTRVRNADDLSAITPRAALGAIPVDTKSSDPVFMHADPRGAR
ncbi:Wzz/FepE/Etk N-terminal domain-containing protein, partial [Georgenia sp. 10Sc9-8]|nr:Wzz/FepE/Etk N-terminal domain-containing protein [Georgenia halotolerans]